MIKKILKIILFGFLFICIIGFILFVFSLLNSLSIIAEILAGLLFGGFCGFIIFRFYRKISKRRLEDRAVKKFSEQNLTFSDGKKKLKFIPDNAQLGELEPLQKGNSKNKEGD